LAEVADFTHLWRARGGFDFSLIEIKRIAAASSAQPAPFRPNGR
jgi:hypothetical protein